MQTVSKIVIAVLFVLGALPCLASLTWQGVLAGIALLAWALTVFIENNRWRAWLVPGATLAFTALSAWVAISYLTGETVYAARECTGSKKALCQVTDQWMLAGGPTASALLWLAVACLLAVAAYFLRKHYLALSRR